MQHVTDFMTLERASQMLFWTLWVAMAFSTVICFTSKKQSVITAAGLLAFFAGEAAMIMAVVWRVR